jgi:hypothetical protein
MHVMTLNYLYFNLAFAYPFLVFVDNSNSSGNDEGDEFIDINTLIKPLRAMSSIQFGLQRLEHGLDTYQSGTLPHDYTRQTHSPGSKIATI